MADTVPFMDVPLTTAIELDAVTKCFGEVRAVDSLNLAIGRGETVALLGPNGAGKSTTIGMMLGLLAPDRGTVKVFNRSPAQVVAAGMVGAMLQDGGLPGGVKVSELIAFARSVYPRSMPTRGVLAIAGLEELAGQRVDKLSGGQRQRVRFALALAGNPDLLVLDEPTVGMDVESRRAFWAGMRAYAADGHTLLFATHYLEEADAQADRVVVITRGHVVASGSGAEIKRSARGQVVSFDLDGTPLFGLEGLPGVVEVEVHGQRVRLRTNDADATVAALIRERGMVRNLQLGGPSLEDAFVALTENDEAKESA